MLLPRRTDLTNIIEWLKGNDESRWDDQTRLLSETISELEDFPRQATKGHEAAPGSRGRPSAESNSYSQEATSISVAMPELMKMLKAMQDHNRAGALEYGQAALGLLPVE